MRLPMLWVTNTTLLFPFYTSCHLTTADQPSLLGSVGVLGGVVSCGCLAVGSLH